MSRETNRPGMVLYHDKYRALSALDDHDFRLVIDALMRYSETGEQVALEGYLGAIYQLLAAKLDEDIARYERQVEQRREAGRKSARARRAAQSTDADFVERNQRPLNFVERNATKSTNQNQSQSQNQSQNRNQISLPLPPQGRGDGEREEAPERPTLEQVRGCVERMRLDCDPDAFYRACEETGWTDGNGNPIRSWKIWLGNWAMKHRQTRRSGDMTQPDDRVAEFERLKQKYLQEEQDNDEG